MKFYQVYTHFHWDHVAGGGAIQELAESLGQTEPIRIIAHNFFTREYSRQLLLGKSGYPRGMGQGGFNNFELSKRKYKIGEPRCKFGQLLDPELQIHSGLGPRLKFDLLNGYCYRPPNEGFDEKLIINHGKWSVELFHAPGETDEHINVFVPEIGLLSQGNFQHF